MMGMRKHRISGHVPNNTHFTGRSKKTGTPRNQALTRREKLAKRGSHINKYLGKIE